MVKQVTKVIKHGFLILPAGAAKVAEKTTAARGQVTTKLILGKVR